MGGSISAQAGVTAAEVDYLEAHGPGTALGDAIELNAIANVYGRDRDAGNPLLIGSVKTNIGHLEAAGGVASLIKTALAMNRGLIPKHLNFNTPNPDIDWERLPVRVTAEDTAWPSVRNRSPLASVNVFGISGANAHVVVEGYGGPEADFRRIRRWAVAGRRIPRGCRCLCQRDVADMPLAGAQSKRSARLLPLSGKTHRALRQLAERYLCWLDGHAETLDPADSTAASLLSNMAWTAASGRSHFPYRAGVVFQDVGDLRESLRSLSDTEENHEMPEPQAASTVAFAYTGQASQWVGMGKTLYEQEPVARAILDRCDAMLRQERDIPLLDVMFGQAGDAADLDDPTWAHPAIYALECALTALWGSIGIQPNVVVGSDLGEIAAGQAAGVLSLEDGLRLASARGALISDSPAGTAGKPISAELKAVIANVASEPATLPLVSSVVGRVLESDELLDAAYWERQAREPVRLQECLETMAGQGVDLVVEVGPQAWLAPTIKAQWPKTNAADTMPPVVIESQARDTDVLSSSDSESGFLEAVARTYEAGLTVSFAGLFAGESRRRISVPSYPFQRRRHWVAPSKRLTPN